MRLLKGAAYARTSCSKRTIRGSSSSHSPNQLPSSVLPSSTLPSPHPPPLSHSTHPDSSPQPAADSSARPRLPHRTPPPQPSTRTAYLSPRTRSHPSAVCSCMRSIRRSRVMLARFHTRSESKNEGRRRAMDGVVARVEVELGGVKREGRRR